MLTLRSGLNSLVVAPEIGAGVLGWMHGSTSLLRRSVPPAVGGNPHAMGWFPLVPYCNRIGWGGFTWQGRPFHLAANFGDNPHTIHGIGWQRAWTVEAVADSSVSLTLVHQADASWPFGFRSAIDYLVSSRSVTVSMAITNCHDGDAPAGLGLHPFFSKARDPALSFNASGFCENGPDMLPVRLGAIPAEHDHAQPRPVRPSRLDNCFLGWDGCAAIAAGPASLIVEASEVFGNLQVFTPGWGDFFCVEPVSHVPDALSRPDLPFGQAMHVLKPNETLRGTITMTLPET